MSTVKFCALFILLFFIILSCHASNSLPLENLRLPEGFTIHLFATVPGARSMTLGRHTIFVSTLNKGKIYAIVPNSNLTEASKIYVIADGLSKPNGIAFYQGNLYIAETDRIISLDQIESNLQKPLKPRIVLTRLPNLGGHDWRYMKLGPDRWLYFSIGAPCNVCKSKNPDFATIMRMLPDGSQVEIFAKGVRNSVGFDWDPHTKELWFTDNGRDNLGDDLPPDELNHATQPGLHFGFPFVYGKNIPDPFFSNIKTTSNFITPEMELGAHVAALGMVFYRGHLFPKIYQNQIFIAEHGSWNRSSKVGYRVTVATVSNNKAVAYHPFISGWLQGEKTWGRPVDILELPNGSLLISDDYAGVIYQVLYRH